jgi:L-threonylcarbamoyladenylate synthase
MQTKVVKLDPNKADIAKIKGAAALVDAGGLVAFPTESVYGIACRAHNNSLIKLNNLKDRGPDKYYSLHISQKNAVEKYIPTTGLKADKLIRKAWPGPLTIVFELDEKDIKKQKKRLIKKIPLEFAAPTMPSLQYCCGQHTFQWSLRVQT